MQNRPFEMLTIRQCAARGILKEHQLRTLVKSRKIPFIMVGNKALVNYTALCEQLQKPDNIEAAE
jgi:hypothetical protein